MHSVRQVIRGDLPGDPLVPLGPERIEAPPSRALDMGATQAAGKQPSPVAAHGWGRTDALAAILSIVIRTLLCRR